MKKQLYFAAINLGCTKNLVDSQFVIGNLLSKNNPYIDIEYVIDPYDDIVELVFLNTCGFIQSARNEMLETIEILLNHNKKVFLLGCGLKYYMDLNKLDIPKMLFDTNVFKISWTDIDKLDIDKLKAGYESKSFNDFTIPSGVRIYSNIEHKFEYLKISEGCNTNCSFCIIPKIRGRQVSLTIDQILEEAKNMLDAGVKEIILIAQDTSSYGTDIYGKPNLLELLDKLDKIDRDFTYRLLYLYPDLLTIKHLEKMQKLEKFIPYFDIPLQHVSNNLLKNMKRSYNKNRILELLEYINNNFEEKYIRTNFIVGFPGETDADFQELFEFIERRYFDNIALFEYHDEKLADSFKLDGKVKYEVIRERFVKLEGLVNKIFDLRGFHNKGKQFIGYVVDYISQGGKTKLMLRPYLHAPEIDPIDIVSIEKIVGVFENKTELEIGDKLVYEL